MKQNKVNEVLAMSTKQPSESNSWKDNLKHDLPASLVVFLVALPLCMGIAIASGVDPARGLLTGIIGGLVAATFAGSPLGVSGPAAGLTVLVYQLLESQRAAYLAEHPGAVDAAARHALIALGVVVLLCGLLQIGAGVFKLGRWFRAVSPAVIRGMLAGIGVLILASQFHVMIDDVPSGSGLQNLLTIPLAVDKAFRPGEIHRVAAATGVVTIVTLLVWAKFAPKRFSAIPSPLVAVVVATIFCQSLELGIKMIDVPANLFAGLYFPSQEWLPFFADRMIWIEAFGMAAVASAETLLCATAVDQMHTGPRTRYDRELIAQGIGNATCGVCSALPMTAVIVRSSANVQAGARTRMSAILHGAWLLLFVCSLPWLLAYVPRSALGAILVYTGYKLVNWQAAIALWKQDRSEAAIFGLTLATIVGVDLLSGVITGVVLAAIKLLWKFSHLKTAYEEDADGRATLKLVGACTFVRLPDLAEALESLPPGKEVHVDLEQVDYIDHASLDLLYNAIKQLRRSGGDLVIDWELVKLLSRSALPGNNGADNERANRENLTAAERVPR